MSTTTCGRLTPAFDWSTSPRVANKEKHLKVIVGYVTVRLAYGDLKHLETEPQPKY